MISDAAFWALTIALGLGTFAIRFSFLGLVGARRLPDWLLLHLKYVGAAVFPALVLPMILWPDATGGTFEPLRLVAALAALAAGIRFSVLGAIIAGLGVFYLGQALGGF